MDIHNPALLFLVEENVFPPLAHLTLDWLVGFDAYPTQCDQRFSVVLRTSKIIPLSSKCPGELTVFHFALFILASLPCSFFGFHGLFRVIFHILRERGFPISLS